MPAAKPCWDVLFCMIFYEWNGKLFDRTIFVPGTDNQELVNLVAAGNRDDKIINGIKADTRAVIFRLGQEYHIDLLDRKRQCRLPPAVRTGYRPAPLVRQFQAAEHCR